MSKKPNALYIMGGGGTQVISASGYGAVQKAFTDYREKLGTFYVSIGNLEKRIAGWRNAIKNGHEIGNHSLKHPCTINYNFNYINLLENYTTSMMRMELYSSNEILKEMLGIRTVSFAYPCGQTFIGRGENTKSYVPLIAEIFETGRGWLDEGPNDPLFCDLFQLTGMELDGK